MITIDTLDRDILASFAAGARPAELTRHYRRWQRVTRLVCAVARSDRRQAARLVHVFDTLAARPVAELSPSCRPLRVMPDRFTRGQVTAWPVINRKEHSTWQ